MLAEAFGHMALQENERKKKESEKIQKKNLLSKSTA